MSCIISLFSLPLSIYFFLPTSVSLCFSHSIYDLFSSYAKLNLIKLIIYMKGKIYLNISALSHQSFFTPLWLDKVMENIRFFEFFVTRKVSWGLLFFKHYQWEKMRNLLICFDLLVPYLLTDNVCFRAIITKWYHSRWVITSTKTDCVDNVAISIPIENWIHSLLFPL